MMIEMIYKEENQGDTNESQEVTLRIPKNIRQIGTIHGSRKIYVEDYVITYLQQFSMRQAPRQQVIILLGRTQWLEEKQYFFISGAIHVNNVEIEMEEIKFSDECWMRIYGQMKKYFDRLEIVGWFLSSFENPLFISEAVVCAHVNNFPGNDKVFMMLDPQEREDAFYHYENGQLIREGGYYIYYEKNREMQEYIIQHREEPSEPVKVEVEDEATRQFREMMQAKKEKKHEKQTMSFLYAASTVMVLVFMLIGITMINNYDKMLNMESSITTLSNLVDPSTDSVDVETADTQETSVPVESVAGNVERQNVITNEEAKEGENQEKSTSTEKSPAEEGKSDANFVDNTKENQDAADSTKETQEKTENATQETSAEVAEQYHTVTKGETLEDISIQYYGVSSMIKSICNANGIKNSDQIFPGQKILIPQK